MSRFIAFFALLALAAAYPASDDFPRPISTIDQTEFENPSPWFRFPPFGNIFAPLTKLFSSFADIGPRIIVDDDKFQVIVNVKDYKKEDLKVKVKGDFILIEGAHEAKHDDHDLFASQFFHTYTLPQNASASDVTATLSSDGYLEVTAPINGADEKEKAIDREVPIVESGKPFKEEKEPVVPAVQEDKVDNTDKVDNNDKVDSTDKVDNTDKVENNDKVEIIDNVENTRRVGNTDKVENIDKVENVDKDQNYDKVETLDAPVVPIANIENSDKLESVEPTADVEKDENVDKLENVEPTATAEKVENVNKLESVEPTDTVEKVENIDKLENVEPTATIEKANNVDKVEQPLQVAPEVTNEAAEDKKEVTTPASDREEVTVPVQDIKVPQDNEVNEIKP